MKTKGKLLLAGLVILVIAFIYQYFDFSSYLNFQWLRQNADVLSSTVEENFLAAAAIFFVVYVLATALSVPGATVLTLAGGFLFGLASGLILVSFASAIGASLAFLASRFILQDWVKSKFRDKMKEIEAGIEREGKIYLLSLRLIPLFPFVLINLVMGVTPMKVTTFYWVSQLGMLPGTFVYVNAGTQLAKIDSVKDVFSPSLILAFTLLGIFPLVARFFLNAIKRKKTYKNYQKPKRFDYNLVVIGAGSAGLVTAYIAAALKAKVALIEKHKMGGDCLNTGCVPSKAIIKSAKALNMVKKASRFGIDVENPALNFKKVMERVHDVIKKIEPHDSIERYSSLGVDCMQGEAKIVSPYEVFVRGKTVSAKNIVVATGARPAVPPIPGLDDVNYLTSDTIWNLKELPKKLVVLGGGPIGCELAQAFARLGSEVVVIEMGPRLMKVEDPEVSEFVEKKFQSEGIKVLCSHKATNFEAKGGEQILHCESNGEKVSIDFTHALLALGRKANTTGFGLEELSPEVALDKNGTISNNIYMETNYPNIYACGDVAGPYQFTHTAAHQAWYASVNALLSPFKKFKADYRVIPWCTFVDPEVARVGINEQEAKEKKIDYEVVTYPLEDLDRAIADSEDEGSIKVLTEKGKDKILGATIVGTHAADMISEFTLAMKHNLGLNKILGTIHLYPSYPEGNKYLAGNWKKAHKPEKVLKWVEKFHSWRR